MIVKDAKGNELLAILPVEESEADALCSPITHALAVVKLGNEYLMGWNQFRQDWEIFGGCREEGETLRQCMEREALEELGVSGLDWSFLGLMHLKMAPGYFNPSWHEEYGGLYGVTLPEDSLEDTERSRADREEIGKLALYSRIQGKEAIAPIDEALLEYWK